MKLFDILKRTSTRWSTRVYAAVYGYKTVRFSQTKVYAAIYAATYTGLRALIILSQQNDN
eukprot:5771913-Heterocapsa_arctica.AAC.1